MLHSVLKSLIYIFQRHRLKSQQHGVHLWVLLSIVIYQYLSVTPKEDISFGHSDYESETSIFLLVHLLEVIESRIHFYNLEIHHAQ